MKTQIKEIYKCDHCNKLYQIKNRCADHELICFKNPANNRACFGCNNLIKKDNQLVYTGYSEVNGDNEIRSVSLLYCTKLNHYLYPPKIEHKGKWYDTYDIENKAMPKECEHFSNEFEGF